MCYVLFWRWTQSAANPSQWISLFNRERTGNLRQFELKPAFSTIISSCFQRVADDFPKTKNREIKKRIREFHFPVTHSQSTFLIEFQRPNCSKADIKNHPEKVSLVP